MISANYCVPPASRGYLTDKEFAIAWRVAMGDDRVQIARRLHITENTLRNHMAHIFQALDICCRTQLAVWVIHETGIYYHHQRE